MKKEEIYVGMRVMCLDAINSVRGLKESDTKEIQDNYVVTEVTENMVSCLAVSRASAFDNSCSNPITVMHYGLKDLHLLKPSEKTA